MNARNSRTRSDVDTVMPPNDSLEALLTGAANDSDDAVVAAFCADLRRQLGGQTVGAAPQATRWVVRPSRSAARVASMKVWFATTIGALTFAFGGVAAAGALPSDLQRSVANVAHEIGLGFVPDGGSRSPSREADDPHPTPEPSRAPGSTRVTSPQGSEPTDAAPPTGPTPTVVTTPPTGSSRGTEHGEHTDDSNGDDGHDDRPDANPTPTTNGRHGGGSSTDPRDQDDHGDESGGVDDHSTDDADGSHGADQMDDTDAVDDTDGSHAPDAADD